MDLKGVPMETDMLTIKKDPSGSSLKAQALSPSLRKFGSLDQAAKFFFRNFYDGFLRGMESEGKLVPDGHAGPFRDAVILVTFFQTCPCLSFIRQNPYTKIKVSKQFNHWYRYSRLPKNQAFRCRRKRSRDQAISTENMDN